MREGPAAWILSLTWGATAAWLGAVAAGLFPVIAGLPFTLLRSTDLDTFVAGFELAAGAFFLIATVNAVALPLLTALLWGFGRLARRQPLLENNTLTTTLGCWALGMSCQVGVLLAMTIGGMAKGLGGWNPLLLPFGLVTLTATGCLLIARLWLPLPAGALLRPSHALAGLRPRSAPVLRAVLIAAVLVGASLAVETTLFLDCVDPAAGDSCVEPVVSRGLPAPFVKRSLDGWALGYDLAILFSLALLLDRAAVRTFGRRRDQSSA